MKLAKVNGEKAVAAAKAALGEVQRVLEEGKKAQEATASVASAKVKLCKELVPPTIASKDEAGLCAVVKECNTAVSSTMRDTVQSHVASASS